MKRIIVSLITALLVCIVIITSVSAAGLLNFVKVNEYKNGKFTDVIGSSWYAENVKTAYEYGLVKGSSETTFKPTGNVTIAEAVTLACRIHSIYNNGSESFVQGTPWYKCYMDYAKANRIIGEEYNSIVEKPATRIQFATILSASLPDEAMSPLNEIKDNSLPDVSVSNNGGKAVYRLYRAGVLTGNDTYGTYAPNATITRAETATIVTRLVNPELRKHIVLSRKPTKGEEQAVKKAKSYLEFMSFSREGLIGQLEYEKFTSEEAIYGVNNCGANWNEQAVKKAKSYLEIMAFSQEGLIEQLEYEKFTHEEAVFGVNSCDVDWNEQAAKKAKSYLETMGFSRDVLIEQLEFEKFTHEQAVYGAEANGY